MEQRDIVLAEQRNKNVSRANRMIFVTFQREGIHSYPEAATDSSLKTNDYYDVSFLATPHRHIFHFKVWISVTHSNRDIEFIQFKRWLQNLYTDGILHMDHLSCEMLAEDLYLMIAERYPNREVWIEISEDGENGAFIKFDSKN